MKNKTKLWLALSSMLFTVPLQATVIYHPDFSDTSMLTLNGDTTTPTTSDGTVLRLTPAAGNQSGSAFSSTTLNASDFSTYFTFRITDPGGTIFDCNQTAGADGIVFVAQSVSSSIGGAGAGIGYAGISNSVGVEFDTWCNGANNDPSSNHLGIDINGNVNHGPGAPNTLDVLTDFDDGNIWHAWVDYDGTNIDVRANQTGIRPLLADLSMPLDLPTILGTNNAFVGFTSGTGADWGNHDILTWEYRDRFNPISVPLPATLWLFAAGFVGLMFRRR